MMRSSLISPTIRLANERKDSSWARTTMAITAVRNWCSSSTEADSMGGLESDTIGGFNSMLSKQRTIAGECRVTTLLFDHRIETLHNHLDIREVNDLTSRDYWVRGSTALLDAIGLAIDRMIVTQRHTAAAYRAQHVLFVIITDGYENASRRYSLHQIKQMITYERERYHWEFVFLGANIDAEQTAGDFGISPRCATDFHADGQGIKASFEAVACAATAVRGGADLDDLSAPDFLVVFVMTIGLVVE